MVTSASSIEASLTFVRGDIVPAEYSGYRSTKELPTEQKMVQISDLRKLNPPLSLDTNAIALLSVAPFEFERLDQDEVIRRYRSEVGLLIEQVTGAHKVFVLDHIVRSSRPGKGHEKPIHSVHL